jgi:hypothetical protein
MLIVQQAVRLQRCHYCSVVALDQAILYSSTTMWLSRRMHATTSIRTYVVADTCQCTTAHIEIHSRASLLDIVADSV